MFDGYPGVGCVACLLLTLWASLGKQHSAGSAKKAVDIRILKIFNRLKDCLITERKRSDRWHFEAAQQVPLVTDAEAETGRHAEVAGVAAGKTRMKVGRQREAEIFEIRGVGPGQVNPGGKPRIQRTKGPGREIKAGPGVLFQKRNRTACQVGRYRATNRTPQHPGAERIGPEFKVR